MFFFLVLAPCLPGESQSVKRFERSNGLDTALYKKKLPLPMPAWCRFLPQTLFLLPIQRMPNRSESHRSTRCVFHGRLYLLGDINNNDIIVCIVSRSCKDSISTCFACSCERAEPNYSVCPLSVSPFVQYCVATSRKRRLNWTKRRHLR